MTNLAEQQGRSGRRGHPRQPGNRWDPTPTTCKYTGEDHVVLGGPAMASIDDILIASIGDDTVYGDGGNDTHRRWRRQRHPPRRRRRRHHHRPGRRRQHPGRRRQRRHPRRQRHQPDPRRLRQRLHRHRRGCLEAFGGAGNDFILGVPRQRGRVRQRRRRLAPVRHGRRRGRRQLRPVRRGYRSSATTSSLATALPTAWTAKAATTLWWATAVRAIATRACPVSTGRASSIMTPVLPSTCASGRSMKRLCRWVAQASSPGSRPSKACLGPMHGDVLQGDDDDAATIRPLAFSATAAPLAACSRCDGINRIGGFGYVPE